MKVALIAFNNIRYSPYILMYADYLNKRCIEYDLIYPNRDGLDESFSGNKIALHWDASKHKAFNFLSFARKTKKLLKRNRYDFVIVLTTFPAVLLSGYLSRHYKNRYIIDVRDYTYEHNGVYFHFEKKALENAAFTVISSPGFVNFLPKGDYCLCHNLSKQYNQGAKPFHKKDGKLIIGYIGTIAYKEQCKKLIDLVLLEEDFEFHLYGNEIDKTFPIKQYVETLNNDRIKYFGGYLPSEKDAILQSIDILFNIYGNDRPLVKYALSNKLYDGFYYKKPLLVSPNTAMQTETGEYSYAIEFNTENELQGVRKWYKQIDDEKYEDYANDYLVKAFADNDILINRLEKLMDEDYNG